MSDVSGYGFDEEKRGFAVEQPGGWVHKTDESGREGEKSRAIALQLGARQGRGLQ